MNEEDSELRDLLREWQAPPLPSSLEGRVFGARRGWWRSSVSVPLPVACSLALLFAAILWRSLVATAPVPATRVLVRTERVEVPVVHERVVTRIVYRNRPAPQSEHMVTFSELRPVSELRLKIVRLQDGKN